MASLFNYADPNSLVSRLRLRRSQLLRELIADVTAVTGDCRVLDVGGESSYWLAIFGTDWLRANRVHVTLLNHTLEYVGTPDRELFTVVIADGCALPYGDQVFDLIHSNSVIEHVGAVNALSNLIANYNSSQADACAACFPMPPCVENACSDSVLRRGR
jgi:hypothetical protein